MKDIVPLTIREVSGLRGLSYGALWTLRINDEIPRTGKAGDPLYSDDN